MSMEEKGLNTTGITGVTSGGKRVGVETIED